MWSMQAKNCLTIFTCNVAEVLLYLSNKYIILKNHPVL